MKTPTLALVLALALAACGGKAKKAQPPSGTAPTTETTEIKGDSTGATGGATYGTPAK